MQTYTAIAVMTLLGITLSANAARAFETPLPSLETATAEYMLSAQTSHKGERRRTQRPPTPRRSFTQSNVYTHPL